ncbi:MAG: PilZ domain-containing protein [Acidobacteria bacterium]|nr:PilZ domain-containing protein [Acidobacteriota bacterium]
MGWRNLLVTHDQFVHSVFALALTRHDAQLEVLPESKPAQELLEQIRFGLVLIDCDDVYGGASLLRAARSSLPNRSSMLLAVTNGETHAADALDSGADAVLSKPVQPDLAEAEVERLWRRLEPDQRADIRFHLKIPVFVSSGDLTELRAETFNISRGGLGMRCSEAIASNDMVHLRWRLPGILVPVQAHGEIAWADREGNCGIRFIAMSDASRHAISEWLDSTDRAHLNLEAAVAEGKNDG